MKSIPWQKTATALLSALALGGCFGCMQDDEEANPGTTTEAENALALRVVDSNGATLAQVQVSLCAQDSLDTLVAATDPCSPILRATVTGDDGTAAFDSLPNGAYLITMSKDLMVETFATSLSGGIHKDLGALILDGIPEDDTTTQASDTALIGSWKYLYSDSGTDGTISWEAWEAWSLQFHNDHTLDSWRYEWRISAEVEFAPSETLSVAATWEDVGTLQELFPDLPWSSSTSEIGNSHAILTPLVSNPQDMRWADGYILHPMGDSLIFHGDIQVFQQYGTQWLRSTAEPSQVSMLELETDGSATITVDSASYQGTWSLADGYLDVKWARSPGDTGTLHKLHAIHNARMLLLDQDDPATFYRE